MVRPLRIDRDQVVRRARLILAALAVFASGCVTTSAHHWGEDATATPGFARIRSAAADAVRDPHVWVPLAGAALFQIGGWDRKVSNWARDNTPVFGSQRGAQDWSDRLRTASSVAYFTTVVLTPGPEDVESWLRDKAKGVTVGLGAIATAGLATSALKGATGRTRPNGEGTNSFPSGHTSHSAVLTGLARDDLEYEDLSPFTRTALDAGLDLLTAGTAWARIEAGAHFPSDTLASIGLGNFVSRVFDRSFLDPEGEHRLAWSLAPTPGGAQLTWEVRF